MPWDMGDGMGWWSGWWLVFGGLLWIAFWGVWGAKTPFTPRDHPDLQAEPSADAPRG